MTFLYTASAKANMTPPNGHSLTEGQKQLVKEKRPESVEREGKTGVGCSFRGGCNQGKSSMQGMPVK